MRERAEAAGQTGPVSRYKLLDLERRRVRGRILRRFWLRWHIRLILAATLGKVRRMDEFDWEGSVLKFTWKPFAAVAAFAIIAGLWAAHIAPGVRTLGEILMQYR